ncbi:hypothetical protein ACO2Q9_11445 [Variovorax sp. VNK109]|uniref:hypothetical protein n=1 Tax=Variovorax sp. VNK109 TaxID=3400919 RepID=UPI003C0B8D1E
MSSVHLMDLQPGQRIALKNQAVCEVLENMGDGIWVQVRYITSPSDPSMEGSEELCHCEEVVRVIDG